MNIGLIKSECDDINVMILKIIVFILLQLILLLFLKNVLVLYQKIQLKNVLKEN